MSGEGMVCALCRCFKRGRHPKVQAGVVGELGYPYDGDFFRLEMLLGLRI